jgi:dTMP kinase
MKSKFIVLEGIDGAGTTTQAELLQNYFISINQKAVISPEPTSGKIGKLLRELLSSQEKLFNSEAKFEEQMAYLFAADRHYHLYNKIDGVYTLINQNIEVITPRYYFSSLAYNAHNEEDFKFISTLNQKFSPPDYLIYLDLPVDIALNRIKDRPVKEIYETAEKLTNVYQNYDKIFEHYQGKILRVNATLSKDEIHSNIVKFINPL